MELKLPDIVESLFRLSKRLGESLVLGTVGLSAAAVAAVMHFGFGEPLDGWLYAGAAMAAVGYGCAIVFAVRKHRYESEAGMTYKEAIAKVREIGGRVTEAESTLSRYVADDEADAAKLGMTAEEVGSLGVDARSAARRMTDADVGLFRLACSMCVGGPCGFGPDPKEAALYMREDADGGYGEGTLDLKGAVRLEDLGLVHRGMGRGGQLKRPTWMNIAGAAFALAPGQDAECQVKFGDIVLTPAGEELASFQELGGCEGFTEHVLEDLKRQGVSVIPIVDGRRSE